MSTPPLPPNAPVGRTFGRDLRDYDTDELRPYPQATMASLYSSIRCGKTIAEGVAENGPMKFVVLAAEHVFRGDARERIRVYSISPTSGFLDIGACLAPPVEHLTDLDDNATWRST